MSDVRHQAAATGPQPGGKRRRTRLMTPRRVNLLLEVSVITVLATGIGSWLVANAWSRPFTVIHGLAGLGLVVLTPFKLRGPVRTGMARNPGTRWVSAGFGLMVLGAALFGFLHTAGIWHGVGEWSALWTHHLLGFVALPFFVWHLWSRPVRPSRVDLNRRSLLAGGSALAVAGAALVGMEVVTRAVGSNRGRASTGSRQVGSFDPALMPSTVWIDDKTPPGDRADWELRIAGSVVDIDELAAATTPLDATLDCTGGWWSEQRWDVVPLASVLPAGEGRSIRVTSATGYARLFTRTEAAEEIFLAFGYGGEPLRARHGAPVRVVAPGRRGPWWVKWVSSIDHSSRPAWTQLPLPPT